MAILKDTILVATATLCVGSALMEIPSESKSFNKFFPYVGTFISAGIGYYFLRRSNIIKASEYQPSQEMDDYSLNEITHSSAIEGFEPLKFSVVGNRAEGLETIFDAEGAFGEKPSINFSWNAYDDSMKETKDRLILFEEMKRSSILVTDATHSLKDKMNIEFDMIYPNDRMQFTDIDLRGYYDFNGGRFYLIKYDYFALKMKTKKGQPNFKIEPAYLVYYGANDYFGEWNLTLIAGASGIRSHSQLIDVAPIFNGRQSFKDAYKKLLKEGNVGHLAFNNGRKAVTNLAMRYLYFNCLTPKLELDFDEELDVASDDYAIEKFQNMIIPYSYKVKVAKEYGGKRTITNYYYVDENGDCKFFIAISIDEFGLMRFLGDNKSQLGVSDKDEDIQKGIIHELQKLFEFRPLLKLWLKAVVMDSSNLNNRRINMWNNERSKWFKQQYEPMLYQNWMPVLYTNHKNINACNYILFMKACLKYSEELENDSPATVQALRTDSTMMDDFVALELFKKYFSTIQQWENLAVKFNGENFQFDHPQFYNNLQQFKLNRLQYGYNETGVRISGANKYSIIATEKSKNTIVPISSWFDSKMPCVLPLEISNTKDLKVRAFRKIYNKYALDSLGFWIDEESAEENSYYTNKEKKLDTMDDYIKSIREENYTWDKSMLKNLFLDPHEDYKKFEHPLYKSYTDYSDEMEAESDYVYGCDYCEQGFGHGILQINLTKIRVEDGDSGYKMDICDNCLEKWESGVLFDDEFYDMINVNNFESESSKKPHSVTISRSSNSEKKLMAVFEDSEGKKIKTTHFGQRGASDYTKHGDKERMQRYLERHGGGTTTSTKEDWKDPTTAGALSRWILWNKPSLKASFDDYKSRFGLKGSINVSKSAEERKCKSCEKPATTVVQEGSFCYECLPINLGAENQPLCANKPCVRIANGTDGIGFCMPCEDDASNNRLIKEATEWVGFCPECNKWRTKDMSVKIDSKINTTGWSIPDKLLGKRLCKKSQRFGKIRQSGDTFTGYGSRSFDNSYCGTPLTKVKSKYKAEYEAKSPAQDSLDEWNDKKWKTKSGKPSGETGERFLPTKAIESLTDKEYKQTSDKKRRDSKKGKQFSDQPKKIAEKTAKYRAEKNHIHGDLIITKQQQNRDSVGSSVYIETKCPTCGAKGEGFQSMNNAETFEAIEGTGSKARFTDTPDSKVYRDTSLRQKARNKVLKGTKGGNAGQWSAIKANLSATEYRNMYENKYGEGKNPYF